MRVMAWLALFTAIPLLFFQSLSVIVVCVILYSLFWNAILPQLEALTLDWLDTQPERYGSIRIWGSLSFITVVMLVGASLASYSSTIVPMVLIASLLLIALSLSSVPDRTGSSSASTPEGFGAYLAKPAVIVFFVVAFLLQVSHGVYYALFSLFLDLSHYSRTGISYLWSVGVIAEVILFLLMAKLFHRWSIAAALPICLAISAIRWVVLAVAVDSTFWVVTTQLLHAFSYAAHHGACMVWIAQVFPSDLSGKAQAFYAAVCFGLGGAVGAFAGGEIWLLNPMASFLFASFSSGLALLIWLVAATRLPDLIKPLSK